MDLDIPIREKTATAKRPGVNFELWKSLERIRIYLGLEKKVWVKMLDMTDQKYRALPRARKSINATHLVALASELEISVDSIVTGNLSMESLRHYRTHRLASWLQKQQGGNNDATPRDPSSPAAELDYPLAR